MLSNCSFVKKDVVEQNNEGKDIFEKIEPIQKELNPKLNIQLSKLTKEKPFLNNNSNNSGNINFETNFQKTSSYKFKVIKKYKYNQPELIFTDDKNIIFFDGKGSVFKINEDLKEVWKVNNYNKKEKKLNPILYFAQNGQNLIVNDNLSKLYSIKLSNGDVVWSKYNRSSFNSDIKIFKDRFFTIDFDNIIRCFSIKDGKEIWNFKSENSFIKSQKKLSLLLKDDIVFFINNLGDITALESMNGSLVWQTPTQSNVIYQNAFTLENSDLVFANNSIYFSNNKNEFFSIDVKSGIIKWKQTVNSILRPTVIENLIFSISTEGFLFVIEDQTGNILRINNTLANIKNKNYEIKPIGFVVARNKIYLSLNNGRLLKIDIKTGLQENIYKLRGSKISRPYVFNGNMYLIKDNAIIKAN
ncbi:PQQ-like beta-propeller repeat protein [Candidatus Pelagibacter sp.]|nr:PQQ-like beta-propeller repeat protein [Candidatus Pelagibacter sp.]